jgi:hypothetical protein
LVGRYRMDDSSGFASARAACPSGDVVRGEVRLGLVLIVIGAVMLLLATRTDAHFRPGTHNAVHAIQQTWCGKANRECWQGNEAIRVARCESASYWTRGIPHMARNGQYLGMMQMGEQERRLYGHGPDPWSQARAAHYYWVVSGRDWSPWECKP